MSLNKAKRLVEEIQAILSADDYPLEEILVDLAGRHEDTVNETRQRLRAVDNLVSRGLQAEAAELAEREPPLRTMVQLLDFPALDEWNELLARFEIAAIPTLPAMIVTNLEDAIETSAAVEPLLNRYRTASLARAPLRVRLSILRRLAISDSTNPHWPADVKLFEQHRISEIRDSLESIVQQQNLSELTTLQRELASQDWQLIVPAEIKRRVSDSLATLRENKAYNELEVIAFELSDAFARFDKGLATHLRQKFEAMTVVSPLAADDPVLDIAGPALDWLKNEQLKADREQDRRQWIEAIESQLTGQTSLSRLDKACSDFESAGFRVPERLLERITTSRLRLEKQASTRRRILLGSLIFVCILGITLTGLIARSVSIKNAISRHEEQLRGLLSNARSTGILSPVEEYLDLLAQESASVSNSERLTNLQDEFQQLKESETARVSSLTGSLEVVKELCSKATELQQFGDIASRIKAAEILVKTPNERAAVSSVATATNEKRATLQAVADNKFEKRLKELESLVATLSLDKASQYDEIILDTLELLKSNHVSEPLLEQAKGLQANLTRQREHILQQTEMEVSLQKINDTVGMIPDYVTSLERYASKFPETIRSNQFRRVIENEKQLWESAVAWNAIRARVLKTDIATVSASHAKDLANEIVALQESTVPYCGPTKLESRLEAIKFVAQRRPGADGSMKEQIKLAFDGKTVTSSYLIETPDGKERYYADAVPDMEKSVSFEHYTTPAGDQTVPRQLSLSLFPDVRERKREDWLSPPTLMTRAVQDLLDKSMDSDFEKLLIEVIKTVVHSRKVDPILRLLLVEKLIRIGAENSYFLNRRMTSLLKEFAESGVPRLTNWVDFEDKEVRRTRDLADDFLRRFETRVLTELGSALEDRTEWSRQKVGPTARWIGWLYSDENAIWVIERAKSSMRLSPGSLCVFLRPDDSSVPQMAEVGSVTSNADIEVSGSILNTSPLEGRPVFLMIDEP